MSIRLITSLYIFCLISIAGSCLWLQTTFVTSIDAISAKFETSSKSLFDQQQLRLSEYLATKQTSRHTTEQQIALLKTMISALQQTPYEPNSKVMLIAQMGLTHAKEIELLKDEKTITPLQLTNYYVKLREIGLTYTKQLEQQKQPYYERVTFIFILLVLFLTFCLVVYLVFFVLKPLKQFGLFLQDQNIRTGEEFDLKHPCTPEVNEIIDSVNYLFVSSNKQLQNSKLLSSLNDKLRVCDSLETYTKSCIEYLVINMKFPGIAILKSTSDGLTVIAQCGKTPFIDPTNPGISATLEQGTVQTYAPDKGSMTILMGNESILLKLIYTIPLTIERGTLGLLYVPSARILEQYEIQILTEVAKDISLAIERAENTTIRQQTQQALAHQLELTHSIINAIPNPTFYRDAHGQFIGINRAFLNFFDQFEIDIVGNTVEQVYPFHIAEYIKTKEVEILSSGLEINYPLQLEDGQKRKREISVFEGPFFDDDGNIQGVVGMFIDVTEHNVMQQELINAKNEADRLTKVKSEFLANMSHEIRTPMNAILGMAHLALKTGLNDQQFNYVNKINYAAKQLLALINDILDFSKIEAGKLTLEHTPFELSKVLDNVATIIEIKANEKGLKFNVEWDENIPNNYVGDPLRLGQILINLAGNAVKFTERGEVNVNVALIQSENNAATIRFSVKDTGIGMNTEQQKALFKSFSQADSSISRKYGGTGLGLTISQQLVKLMGGEIYVESKQGQGSEFYFVVSFECANSLPFESLRPKFTETINALILDDNLHALTITHELLSSMGIQVLSTTDIQEAKRLLAEMVIDIAFIDWKLGTCDGLEFIKEQKHRGTQSKFVLITAYGRDFNISAEDKSHVDCIVLKPATPSYLYDAVVSCMGSSASAPQAQSTNEDKSTLFKGLRILVAEDQPINQEIAVEILKHYGAIVEVANNGQEAIDKVLAMTFDVVLMDMQMPIVDGISATHEIRRHENYQQLPILAMTANAMIEDIERCKQAGMNAHIAKPIDLAQLESTILAAVKDASSKTAEIEDVPPAPAPSKSKSYLDLDLEGVDITEGINRAAGNPKIYFQILEKFLTQQCEELINLQQALSIGDNELSAHLLHAIKGASANLSMHYLADECLRLETLVKSGKTQVTDIDYLVDYIKTQQNKLKDLHIPDANTPMAPDIEVDTLINQLEKALKDYDTNAITIVEQLVAAKRNAKADTEHLPAEQLDQLLIYVTRFEFSDATGLLQQLKQTRQ